MSSSVSISFDEECRIRVLEGEDFVKLLGLQVEEDLSIETHLNSVIKKGNQKLHALMRISKYQSSEK